VTKLKMAAPLVVLTDDEQHTRLRKQIQPGFAKGAMESWQSIVDELATELVAEVLANPGCDVVQQLTIPMPTRVLAYVLGVPDSDIGDFRRWTEASVQVMDFQPTARGILDVAKSIAGIASLRRYFLRQFATGGLKGTDTVLGRLLAHNTDGSLTDAELFNIAMFLLIAGNETTTNLLGGMFDTFRTKSRPIPHDSGQSGPDPNGRRGAVADLTTASKRASLHPRGLPRR
jgi:cytochrome P450